MKRKSLVFLLLLLSLVSENLFSQDTLSYCNCWTTLDIHDTVFKIVPMTEGAAIEDKGVPPNYYNDNGSTLPIQLPFSFCLYGKNYSTVFINNNGNISFEKPIYNAIQNKFPFGADTLMLAPFYADIYTWGGNKLVGGDRVFYQITPTSMTVKWNKVGFYSPGDNDEFNSFQLIITNGTDPILPAGNNVQFCYNGMMWATTSDTTGFGGYPSMIGITGGNKTDFAQFGTFRIPGTQYLGPTSPNNGLGWLVEKSFIFNTCTSAHTIPPVIINEHTCDTVTVCALDSLEFTTSFLSPSQGQTSTLSVSSPGLTGVSIQGTTNSHSISSVTVRVAPSEADAGTHILNVIAKDNSSPPQTNTHPITIVVKSCGVGIDKVVKKNEFDVFPNPFSDRFTLQLQTSELLKNTEVKVYDVLGNMIYSTPIKSMKTDIDFSSTSKGIYFLNLYKENASAGMKKIILSK